MHGRYQKSAPWVFNLLQQRFLEPSVTSAFEANTVVEIRLLQADG